MNPALSQSFLTLQFFFSPLHCPLPFIPLSGLIPNSYIYIDNPTLTFLTYPQTVSSSNSIFWLIPFAYIGRRQLTRRGWRDEAKRKILGILSLNPGQSFTICVVHAAPLSSPCNLPPHTLRRVWNPKPIPQFNPLHTNPSHFSHRIFCPLIPHQHAIPFH